MNPFVLDKRTTLLYYATVQRIESGVATINVIKSRSGKTGIQTMSIELLNELKWMDNYRIEMPIDFENLDFEQFQNIQFLGNLYREHRIDGFYMGRRDASKIIKVLSELA